MREIRLYSLEGGGALSSPYPYRIKAVADTLWRRLATGRVAGWQPAKQPTIRRRYDSRRRRTRCSAGWQPAKQPTYRRRYGKAGMRSGRIWKRNGSCANRFNLLK